jgi:hypothetical protein
MTKIVTSKFKNHIAKQLSESIIEPANNQYYVLFGNHVEYPDGDDTVPTPIDNTDETFILPYQQGVFGKKIEYTDTSRMAPIYTWTTNTVYDMYTNDADLNGSNYYVTTSDGSNYFCYKVLDNNGGAPSTIIPSDTLESACNFSTADGYVWKLMYKMGSVDFEKFATSNFMPVITSANVSGNSVSGSIDVIQVTTPGSDYVSTFEGQFTADDIRDSIPTIVGSSQTYRLSNNASANSNFYVGSAIYITSGAGQGQLRKIQSYYSTTKVVEIDDPFDVPPSAGSEYLIAPNVTVVGDGTNTVTGYATVTSNGTVNNYISKINIVNRGAGYTYATAAVVGNTGGVSNAAVLSVIIPPHGGHGYDAEAELGATSFGISVNVSNSESGFVSVENDYRNISILKDPLFNNVTLELSDYTGTFAGNEKVHQVDYVTMYGTVTTSASSNTITGTSTELTNLAAGDKVIILDPINSLRSLRTVSAVTNTTSVVLNSAPAFSTTIGRIAKANILSTGVRSGNALPYVTMSNTEPKFAQNKYVIGETTGAWGTIANITVGEKSFNDWKTFDNRARIAYTANSEVIAEDSILYQGDASLSNAVYHSSNSTYLFVTSVKGTINPDPTDPLYVLNSTGTIDLGSVMYDPDLTKGSGEIIYSENVDPVSRSNTQSETIRVILSF